MNITIGLPTPDCNKSMAPDGAPEENFFDRLCDALVENIFERILWSPVFLGHQDRDRVQLEAVCKRFQAVVRIAGCLEWVIDQGPQAEQDFIRYVLWNRANGYLKKIALSMEGVVNLMAILQAVMSDAVDSLQEIHLSLEFSQEDAERVDWEHVLVMLQHCKHLEVLHIFLWESRWYDPAVTLDCSRFPKPFPKLRSLSLFGFAVASIAFDSFIATFPNLETLELHHLEGQSYNLSCVKEAFSWGEPIDAGLDGEGPPCMVVPKSLEIVVCRMGSDHSGVREKALRMLCELSCMSYNEVDIQSVNARAAGCLLKLVDLLKDQKESVQAEALTILENLVVNAEDAMTIAAFPGFLKQVVELFGSESEDMRGRAAHALGMLTCDAMVSLSAVVQIVPGVLQGLVNLLADESKDVQKLAASTLAQLADSHGSGELIVSIPSCLENLVSMLENGQASVQDTAARCLQRIAATGHGDAIAKAPRCLEGLVNLLRSRLMFLKTSVVRAVCSLAEDAEAAQRLRRVPKFWQRIVRLLDPSLQEIKQQIYEDAVSVLAHVGVDAGAMKAVSSHPRALHVIVNNVLASTKMVRRKHAVTVLNQLTDDPDIRKAIAAVPGVLQKLNECILNNEDAEGSVRARAAELFQKLQQIG